MYYNENEVLILSILRTKSCTMLPSKQKLYLNTNDLVIPNDVLELNLFAFLRCQNNNGSNNKHILIAKSCSIKDCYDDNKKLKYSF